MDGGKLALWAAVGALAVGACGGKDKGAKNPDSLDDSLGGLVVPKVDEKLCDTTGKRVETYDFNRDNKPDVWKIFGTIKERGIDVEVMTCKQVDFDKDGVKDYVVTYRDTGEMNSEEADLTFDGRFDSRHHFDKKTNKVYLVERDTDFDKKPDVWEKYDKDEQLESVRRDTNADGKPDIWEQYLNGELVAILYDDDFDNRVDRKEQVAIPKPKPLPKTTPPETEAPVPETGDPTEPAPADPKADESKAAGTDKK